MIGNKKKILLVEDDNFIRRAYEDGLSRAGLDVAIATDGRQAMEKIRSDRPDLVLLDLVMAGEDGFRVLEELRGNDKLSSIPVIVLSNLSQKPDVEKCKELGAVDYLVKADWGMWEVIDKVKSYLGEGKGEGRVNL